MGGVRRTGSGPVSDDPSEWEFECPVMAAIHRENYAVRQKFLDEQATERALAQEREFASRQLSLPI
jgi:hypothetical protein